MKYGTYRKLQPHELEPLRDKHFIGWGKDRPRDEFELHGIAWSVPGHPEEILVIFQDDTKDSDRLKHHAYSHIPYPHRLPEDVRRFLTTELAFANSEEFMAQLKTIAQERSE